MPIGEIVGEEASTKLHGIGDFQHREAAVAAVTGEYGQYFPVCCEGLSLEIQ